MNSTTTICLTAHDRTFLKACGICCDAPWILAARDVQSYLAERREIMPDTLEEAVNEAIRREDERAWSDPEAAP